MKKSRKKKGVTKRKLAIVMSGGGTRSAYGAGALLALAEQYGLTEPDMLIAESGSVLSAMFYLSGQYARIAAGWLNSAKQPGFISHVHRPLINIDILIDKTMKKKFPLEKGKLDSAKTEFFVPLTRVDDGKVVYYRYSQKDDPYEILRAAMALPIFYAKSVRIGNTDYVDGGFGAHMNDHIRYAMKRGATHVIVLRSSNGPRMVTRALYRSAGMIWKEEGYRGLAKAAANEMAKPKPLAVPHNVEMVLIAPSKKLPVAIATKAKRKLRAAMNLGYADAANNKELDKLLS